MTIRRSVVLNVSIEDSYRRFLQLMPDRWVEDEVTFQRLDEARTWLTMRACEGQDMEGALPRILEDAVVARVDQDLERLKHLLESY